MLFPSYLRSPALDGVSNNDPYFSSVVLLAVNNNAANGSTTFADQSPVARTLTANGNAAYSSASAPTGMTTSMACDGTGDYISSTNSTDFDFGAGDFTVEAMVNLSSTATQIFICKDDVTNRSWHIAWVSSIGWQFAYWVGGVATNYRPGTGSVSTGTWNHIAASRNTTNLRFYVNGTQVGVANNISTNTIDTKTAVQSVGASGAGSFGLNGYISNVRITKGVGRYASAFTAPTLPLPTS